MHIATKPQTDSVTKDKEVRTREARRRRKEGTFDIDDCVVEVDTHDDRGMGAGEMRRRESVEPGRVFEGRGR